MMYCNKCCMANAFLANLGPLIFKIFCGSMDPPDSVPLVVSSFGICIYLRIRLLMDVIKISFMQLYI
jgi:hypothetical protein